MHLLGDSKHEVGAFFEGSLRVALQEMSGYHTGSDQASGEHSYGATKRSANRHTTTADAGVFDAIALQA